MTSGIEAKRILGLDALRGIGALCVVMLHIQCATFALPLFTRGYLAVDLFFMLSGFVIGQAYLERLNMMRLSVKAYMRIRLRRLYPVMLVGMLIGSVNALIGGQPLSTITTFLLIQMTLMPVLWSKMVFPLNSPQWSLFYEILANLLHARLAPNRTRFLMPVIVLVAAFAFGWGIFHFGKADVGADQVTFLWGIPRVIFGFFSGLLLFKLWRSGKGPRPHIGGLATIIAAAAAITLPQAAGLPSAISDTAIIMTAFPAIIWFAASARFTARGAAVASLVGELSYPLYATHDPLIHIAVAFIQPLLLDGWRLGLAWAGALVVIILIAWGVSRIDRLLQRRLASRPKPPATHAAMPA